MELTSHNKTSEYKDERLNNVCLTLYEASIILRWILGQTPQHPINKAEKWINVFSRMQGGSPLTPSTQLVDQWGAGWC